MKDIAIKTTKLCKSFKVGKDRLEIIKDMDLEIYKDDFTIIMGSSGAGKSTLLYALSTMDKVTSGNVELLGKDITKLNKNDIADIRKNEIAFIFQGINLLPDLNLFENIAYNGYGKNKSKKEVHKKANELLKELGMEDSKKKYPSEVSGGQKQRIAIARALINNPEIVFADEPTGALNSAMGQVVLDMLTELNNKGQSIVMVTHDLKAATRATRLIYLKDGKIDGELIMDKYKKENIKEREKLVYDFLVEKGW